MTLHKTVLMAGVSLLALATPANAGIESLIATAIHGFLLSSTAISAAATGAIATAAANLIVGAAIVVGSTLLTGGRRGGAVQPQEAKSTFSGENSAVIECIGRGRIGGLKGYGNSDGTTRWRLIARLHGPIDAIEAFYVGGREVVVDSDGIVSSPPWVRGPGQSWMKIENKFGDGTETAWGALVSAFPGIWTTAHRVRGIAQSLVTYLNPGLADPKYLTLYQSGVPDTEWVCRASKIYDPRDGTQAAENPATWKWSDNGILALAHVKRRDPKFMASARWDWTKIALEATRADALVATRTGTEKRARAWGMFSYEGARAETLQQILDSVGAIQRTNGSGQVYFELVDDDPVAEVAFTDADIYSDQWQSGPEAVERPNICRVKYYSPERNYELSEIDMTGIAWARISDEVTRYGEKYLDIELPFCPSASQAQRIARRQFALARADRGNITTSMAGLAAWGLYYGSIETEHDAGPLKVWFSPPRVDDANASVELAVTYWPVLGAWNPATDEALAPAAIPELSYSSDVPTQAAPLWMTQVTFPDGGGKDFRVEYNISGAHDAIEVNYRSYTGSLPNAWQSMIEAERWSWAGVDMTGLTVDSRVRIFYEDEGSDFSPYYTAVVMESNVATGVPVEVENNTVAANLDVTVSAPELHVAAIRLQKNIGAGWVTVSQTNARPDTEYVFTDTAIGDPDDVTDWRIQSLTSNGTAGTALTYSYTIPDPP